MEKLEKVIEALTQCYYGKCVGCPYEFSSDMSCHDQVNRDALDQLKGLKTRLELLRVELAEERDRSARWLRESEPVVHARWISEIVKKPDWKGQEREYYQPHSCSHCHTADPRRGESRFCSECGAIMDEKVFEPTPIGKLLFSMRVHKRLKSAGILTMEQLQETDKRTLRSIEGLGKESILEIEEKLAEWQEWRNKNG